MIGATTIGVSGSRTGPTTQQQAWGNYRLRGIGCTEVHHGCCVGSDEFFHRVALEYFRGYEPEDDQPWPPIWGHPPIKATYRMPLELHDLVSYTKPKAYLSRDRDIVDEGAILLATPSHGRPGEILESHASGTWYTINYALRMGKRVEWCDPEGVVTILKPNDTTVIIYPDWQAGTWSYPDER